MYNEHGLVDVALGSKYAKDLDLNFDLQPLDVDDVASPTIKLSDGKCHASFLFYIYYIILHIFVLVRLLDFKINREFT